MAAVDFVVDRPEGGSLFLVRPQTDAAREYLREHVDAEAQWFNGALVVEHRYAAALVRGLRDDGWEVQ
jgi:hypothetical protein